MLKSITIVDDFLEDPAAVRQSALAAGFGTWAPPSSKVGSGVYEGMSFQARHGSVFRSRTAAMGCPVFPNSIFCRITTPGMERAYIHSDREMGQLTCIVYLSDHPNDISGTAFYRHRATGLREMPSVAEMEKNGTFEQFKKDMVEGSNEAWEQVDFVRGIFNRAVIFYAPLFHSRWPMHGLGSQPDDARMICATHFDIS
jgi:hypothetical protein